jgi:RND family efflux transporter MFP subunit
MFLRIINERFCTGRMTLVAIIFIAAHTCRGEEATKIGSASYHGFSQPWELIDVAVAQPGRIDQVSVREGESVQRGALLARLDNDVLLASLRVAKQRASAGGEQASARARLNHAARRRDDIEALLNESHASQSELDQAELGLHEAEAALLSVQEKRDIAEAEVSRIEAELALREIRSPIDGVVIEIKRQRGEYAGGSDPVVAKVAVLKKLRLRINVPTLVAMQMSAEAEVEVEFPEIQTSVSGNVDFISPITDSQSGTVRVDIRLDNPAGQLRSGLLGRWRRPRAVQTHQTDVLAGQTSLPSQQTEGSNERQ